MQNAPLLPQVTVYNGHLWFRSQEDGVCYSLDHELVPELAKHYSAMCAVTKHTPKTVVRVVGPFRFEYEFTRQMSLPLRLPDRRFLHDTPVCLEWFKAVYPLILEAYKRSKNAGPSLSFTLVLEGGYILTLPPDRKSLPPP